MKNKLVLSTALALSIALLTLIGTSTANAQAGGSMQPVADTGLVHLERDEILVVSVSSKRGNNPIRLQFEESSFSSAGPGGGPHVKVFSGTTGALIASFMAFAPQFLGGVSVGAADFTGDGKSDLAVGAGPGGGPHVKVFDLIAAGGQGGADERQHRRPDRRRQTRPRGGDGQQVGVERVLGQAGDQTSDGGG